MSTHRFDRVGRLVGLVMAPLALWASGASADPPPEDTIQGSVEVGTYYNSDDDYNFGNYTGLGKQEWSVLGNFDVKGRALSDDDTPWFFRFQGENLGLTSRWIDGRGGIQGLFDLHVQWDQIPFLYTDDADTPFRGRGGDYLTLPPSWFGSGTTNPTTGNAGFTALGTTLDNFHIDRQRNDLRAGGRLVLPQGFELVAHYLYDHQDGRKATGSVIGNTGGNPRAVIIPETIDFRTDNIDTALRWAGEHAQFEVGYEYSHFNDQTDSLTWQNPYTAITGWIPTAGYSTGFGRKALPPDNTFQQVKASGGYDLPFNTRVMTHVAFGWMNQTDDFQSYTVNPTLIVTTPLPRGDADAQITLRNGGIRITSRPIEKLRLTGEWRYDERDNDTPRRTYIYVGGDSQNQGTISSNHARINLPNSYRSNEARVEASYEVFHRTDVSAAYEFQDIDRKWTETDQMQENGFLLSLHSQAIQRVDIRLEGGYSTRDAGNYFYQAPLVWGFSPQYLASPGAATFENNPLLRKFNLTDRDRTEVRSRVSTMPFEAVTIGGNMGYVLDDYSDSDLGLRTRRSIVFGFDASWALTDWLTTYTYYQNEWSRSSQRGLSFTNTTQAFDPTRRWIERDEDLVHTLGAGFEAHFFEDRLSFHTDVAWSRAKDHIEVSTSSGLPPGESLPDATNHLLDVSVSAEYQIVEHVSARIGYLFEHQAVDDWAVDHVEPDTISQVLTLGENSPSYDAHVVGLSLKFEF